MQTPFVRSGSSLEFSFSARWTYVEPHSAASTGESLEFDTKYLYRFNSDSAWSLLMRPD